MAKEQEWRNVECSAGCIDGLLTNKRHSETFQGQQDWSYATQKDSTRHDLDREHWFN